MEYKDLQKKGADELTNMLAEERGTLYDLRLKATVNQLKNVRSIRVAKRKIAHILTKLQELSATEASKNT